MKKIALLYDRELDFGGVETHILSLLKHIDRSQYQYTIISPISPNFHKKALALGADIHAISPFKPLNFRIVQPIMQILSQAKIDLVHIHSPAAAITGRLAARLRGIPAIVTVHAPATVYYGDRQTLRARSGRGIYISLDRLLNFRATNRLIYVSKRVHDDCINGHLSPPERSVIIPNGIDLAPFQNGVRRAALRSAFGLLDDTPVVAYTGRLAEEKGLANLLEAIKILGIEQGVKFITWLIGSGPQQVELEHLAGDIGLEKNVKFLGYQSAIAEYLIASDCFVMPSRHEAMSIAILEAMAASLACVVTDVGENARLVEDGQSGYVVHPDSPTELATGLKTLLENPDLRQKMGAAAHKKSLAYSDSEMVLSVQAQYQQILLK